MRKESLYCKDFAFLNYYDIIYVLEVRFIVHQMRYYKSNETKIGEFLWTDFYLTILYLR